MEVDNGAAVGSGGVLDFSRLNLNTFTVDSVSDENKKDANQLFLNNNRLCALPTSVTYFSNLQLLDISNNRLSSIGEDFTRLAKLRTLIAKNNHLNEFSLPKGFGSMQLEVLNFSGNRFEEIPLQCTKLRRLQSLSLGGNRLKSIPAEIENLTRKVEACATRATFAVHTSLLRVRLGIFPITTCSTKAGRITMATGVVEFTCDGPINL